jgi:hypothetical protein
LRLSQVDFLGRRLLVPVGAGVVMGWVGTLVVARVSVDGRTKGDRKGCRLPRRPSPTPHPNLSHPYEDEAASQACLQKTYPCKPGEGAAPTCRLGTTVGPDLSRAPPIYRPSVDDPLSAL